MKTNLTRMALSALATLGLLVGQGMAQNKTTLQQPQTNVAPQSGHQQGLTQPGNIRPGVQPNVQTVVRQPPVPNQVFLTKANLRDIDRLVVKLLNMSKRLHDLQHAYLEGQRHAEKLDQDVTALERMAEGLHNFATQADGSPQSTMRLQHDTNEFLQLSFRIARTIDLAQPWLRGNQALTGINQMRGVARNVTQVALQIDRFLPVDPQVIDGQTERLEAAVKELHDEYHEHLDGYEVSAELDSDIEGVESLVEFMHEMIHGKSWGQINLNALAQYLNQAKQRTGHIESLFVRQSRIGVRTQDWIGIEHSRDAISDVLSSAYLLEHMIRKTAPQPATQVRQRVDTRPLRDRHGHPVNPSQIQDRHNHQHLGSHR